MDTLTDDVVLILAWAESTPSWLTRLWTICWIGKNQECYFEPPQNAKHSCYSCDMIETKWLKVAEHSFQEPMPNSP